MKNEIITQLKIYKGVLKMKIYNIVKKTTKIQALKNNACKHNDEIITFGSATEVVKWLLQSNTHNKSAESNIRQSCRSERKKAFGIFNKNIL